MTKNKSNPYSLFVKDIANRRRQRGENVEYTSLFRELDAQWRGLSEEEKQKYKDKLKQPHSNVLYNSVPSQASLSRPSQSSSSSSQSASQSNPTQSTSVKTEPDVEVKETKYNKRPHDADSLALVEPVQKKVRPAIPFSSHYTKGNLPKQASYADMYLVTIRETCESIMKARERQLLDFPFYSISVNVLCRQRQKDEPDIYVPIELAICAYSVKEGQLEYPYHVLINAGSPPTGTVTKAMDHAEKHKITFPPIKGNTYPSQARDDYKKIYREMLNYTKDGDRLLLVLDKREMAQVKGSIEWIHKMATQDGTKLPGPFVFRIIPAVEYITALDAHIWLNLMGKPYRMVGIEYYVKMRMEHSTFDYNSAFMCEYHQQEEYQTKWCAKSCAVRMFKNLEDFFEKRILSMYNIATAKPCLPSTVPAPLAIQ